MTDFDNEDMEELNIDQIPEFDSYERLEEALNFYQQPQLMIKIQGFSPFINNPQCFDDPRFSSELFLNTQIILKAAAPSITHTICNGFQQIADQISTSQLASYTCLFISSLITSLNSCELNGFTDGASLTVLAITSTVDRFLQILFSSPQTAYTAHSHHMDVGEALHPLICTLVRVFGEFSQEIFNVFTSSTAPSRHATLLIQLFTTANSWLTTGANFPFTATALAQKFTEAPETAREIAFSLTEMHPLAHAIVTIFSGFPFQNWSEKFILQLIRVSSQSLVGQVCRSELYAERVLNLLWNEGLLVKNLDVGIACVGMLGFSGFYENYELVADMVVHIALASQNEELSSVLACCYDSFLVNLEGFDSDDLGVKIAVKLMGQEVENRVVYRALGSNFLCQFLNEKWAKKIYKYASKCVIQQFKTDDLHDNSTFLHVVVNLKKYYGKILKNITIADEARRIFSIKLNKGVKQCDLLMLALIGEIGEGDVVEDEKLEETTQRLGLTGIYGLK